MKRFSVVMPVRNPDPERMRHALRSVGSGPQLIIVDDASDEVDLPVRLGHEFGAALYREDSEQGLVAAVNFGISRADGEYVHVLLPDDYLLAGFYSFAELLVRTQGFRTAIISRWLTADGFGRPDNSFCSQGEIGLPDTDVPACAFLARRDWYEANPWPNLVPLHKAAAAVSRQAVAEGFCLMNWPMCVEGAK